MIDVSLVKLAGMQTLDSLRAKKNPSLYEYAACATDACEVFTVLSRLPNLVTEGALSLIYIYIFFLSQTVTNSHIAACWNFLSHERKEKAMLYFQLLCR